MVIPQEKHLWNWRVMHNYKASPAHLLDAFVRCVFHNASYLIKSAIWNDVGASKSNNFQWGHSTCMTLGLGSISSGTDVQAQQCWEWIRERTKCSSQMNHSSPEHPKITSVIFSAAWELRIVSPGRSCIEEQCMPDPPLLLLSRKFEQPTNSSGIGATHVHGRTVLCPCCSLLLLTALKSSTSCWELLESFSNMRCNSPGGIWCLLHVSVIGCFLDL